MSKRRKTQPWVDHARESERTAHTATAPPRLVAQPSPVAVHDVVPKPGGGTRVVIATPSHDGTVTTGYLDSLVALVRLLDTEGISASVQRLDGLSTISLARDLCAATFLDDADATHLLFIDADETFDSADVLAMLRLDVDVIGATVPRKEIDWEAVRAAAKRDERDLSACAGGFRHIAAVDPPETMADCRAFRAHCVGTGLMLIKRGVFERMRDALPHLAYTLPSYRERMHGFFCPMLGQDRFLSEDTAFCNRWTGLGGKIWIYIANVGHTGTFTFRVDPSIVHASIRRRAQTATFAIGGAAHAQLAGMCAHSTEGRP